jgi:hypothetical protein
MNKKFVGASHGLTAGLLAFNFLWAASSGRAQIQSATNRAEVANGNPEHFEHQSPSEKRRE